MQIAYNTQETFKRFGGICPANTADRLLICMDGDYYPRLN